ncbi:V-set and immunoglobulin domain-containing protein 1-like [Haliotis cracherodii]|uniref:V-set and immunoglobulin domain-containing protein 1-like n=1 Tax=Haliotis cracherodii TaxID=6455 RepID=UPI0039E78EBA
MASARFILPVVVVVAITSLRTGTAVGTSLNLIQTAPHAFWGLSLQLKCGVSTNSTTGILLFQRNTYVKCSVKRSDCTQYASDHNSRTQYKCGCGQQSDGNYIYILNATSLHDDVEGNWTCEYQAFSNIIHINLIEPEGPTQIQMVKTEDQTKEGGSVNLTCSASCLPDCSYSWTKGGHDLASRTRGSRGQVLALKGVVGEDSGYYTCTAVNPLSNHTYSISYVQNVPARYQVSADAGMSMFVYGVCAGVAGILVVLFIVCCVFYRKYKKMKRAQDFPYASAQQLPSAAIDLNYYQELPNPQLVHGGYTLAGENRAEVFTTKVDVKAIDGTDPTTAVNPIYERIHDDNVLSK